MCGRTARRALVMLIVLGSARAILAQTAIDAEHPAESAARMRIEQALDRLVNFTLNDTPLNELAAKLAADQGINVELDRKALGEANIAEETPLRGNCQGIRLGAALALALKGKGLNWLVDNESLVITTEEIAQKAMLTKIYPVRDLVLVRFDDGLGEDYDSLIDTLTSTIDPQSWDSAGGRGSVAPFPNSSALVVSQTREVHEQIAQLFVALRAARDVQGISPVEGAVSRRRDGDDAGAVAAQSDTDVEPPRRIHVAGPQPAWRLPQVYK